MNTVATKKESRKRAARGGGWLFKKAGTKRLPADSNAKGNYYLTYYVNGKRVTVALRDEHDEPITDRKKAESQRKRILAPYQSGDAVESLKVIRARLSDAEEQYEAAVDEAHPPLKIAETWTAFLQSPHRPDAGEMTLRQYAGHWRRFAAWLKDHHEACVYLREVTRAMATDYAVDLKAAGLSSNRYNKHTTFLRMIFRVLEESARMAENPFSKVTKQKQNPHNRRELTIDELTTVLGTAKGELGLLLLIGAATGLRLGDCCTLAWNDLDLPRGIIQRVPNKTQRRHPSRKVVLGIPPVLHQALADIPKHRRTGYVLPRMAARYQRDAGRVTTPVKKHFWDCGIDCHAPGTGDQIVREENGTPKRNKAGVVEVESTGNRAVVDVGFHSLRHTWVSMHAAAGTPGAIIQNSVGHANPAMTAHYTHVSEVTARDVAKALPAFAGTEKDTPEKDTAKRPPLPDWARELVESLTAENLADVKKELLAG